MGEDKGGPDREGRLRGSVGLEEWGGLEGGGTGGWGWMRSVQAGF